METPENIDFARIRPDAPMPKSTDSSAKSDPKEPSQTFLISFGLLVVSAYVMTALCVVFTFLTTATWAITGEDQANTLLSRLSQFCSMWALGMLLVVVFVQHVYGIGKSQS